MIELSITYAELSFLRDLVKAKQFEIWQNRFAKRLRKQFDAKDVFRETMNYNVKSDGPLLFDNVPLGDVKCCAYLLYRFQTVEEKIQKEISK